MQQTDSSYLIRCIQLLLLVGLLSGGIFARAAISPSISIRKVRIKPNKRDAMIRIAGQILEISSERPVKNANVMVRGGDMALASKKTDEEGRFEFFIPAKKIGSVKIGLRINYMNHIFAKDDISPISQEILIYINGSILLEENPMAEYSIPIHKLGDPKIGQVMIRF